MWQETEIRWLKWITLGLVQRKHVCMRCSDCSICCIRYTRWKNCKSIACVNCGYVTEKAWYEPLRLHSIDYAKIKDACKVIDGEVTHYGRRVIVDDRIPWKDKKPHYPGA